MEDPFSSTSRDLVQQKSGKSPTQLSTPSSVPHRIAAALEGIHGELGSIASDIKRISMKLAPGPDREIVGARYVADALNCTTQWIGEQVRTGNIPESCIVPGTGKGKPWKFYKQQIEKWLKTR